jgi:hypothetical protein
MKNNQSKKGLATMRNESIKKIMKVHRPQKRYKERKASVLPQPKLVESIMGENSNTILWDNQSFMENDDVIDQ